MSFSLTLVIVAVTVLVSWRAFNDHNLLERLILWPPAVERRKQYDRLLGYGFVHADWMHLIFNMITLWSFGTAVERAFSQMITPAGYVLFYLSAIVVSILPTYITHRNDANYRSLGASGGVSAVLFAFILIQPWSLIFVFFIPAPAILYAVFYVGYSIWMDRKGGDRINHSAHLAGAAFGVMFMLAMEPRLFNVFIDQLLNPRFG